MPKEHSLKGKATLGVIWSSIERFSVQGIQLIITLVLANLLDPSQFGLIAMLGIFIAISQTFIDSGFSNALIQNNKRTEKDFSTVFFFNIALAIIIYMIIFFASPHIARFYNEPELLKVTRWICLNLILFALMVVQKSKLTIALDFKTQARASLIAVIIGGITGIVYAYYNPSVWALVVQQLTTNSIQTILLWIFSRWSPKLEFSVSSFKKMFPFGSKLLLTGLLNTIYQNIYTLIIGKKFSTTDVGYFNQAYKWSQFPSANLSSILTRAIFPVLSEIQDDEKKLRDTYHKYLNLSVYVVFPMMIGLAVLAEPFIATLLPDKWLPAVTYLQIMCIAFMWYPIIGINNIIITIKGRTDLNLKAEIIKKIVAFAILFASLPFGLSIITAGLILYNIIDMCISIYFASKVINTGFLKQFSSFFRILFFSIITGLVAWFTSTLFTIPVLQLLVSAIAGVVTYFLLSLWSSQELKELISLVKSLKKL